MAGESKTTTDHDVIKRWIADRGGRPATVKGTGGEDDAGLLRIDFPRYGRRGSLEEVSWEDFFEKFEEKKLTFLYQDETREGKESRFFKFIRRQEEVRGETRERSAARGRGRS
jgi:hypothetical protein